MKFLALWVSGTESSVSNPTLHSESSCLKRLTDSGWSGKLKIDSTLPTRDEYLSILPVLGYDPNRYYNGEGSLLAARAGVHLEKEDVAFCCDLVTLKHPQDGYFFPKFSSKIVLETFPADSAENELGKELIREINEQLGTESIVFYPVKNFSHLMVWVGGKSKIQTISAEEISGQPISSFLPKGDGANILTRCMEVASQFLQQHPLNEERIAQEKPPLNGIWFSQPGKAMELPTWEERFHLRGALFAEEGLIQGMAALAGLTLVEITGIEEKPFKDRCLSLSKGVIKSLGAEDFVFVHLSLGKEDSQSIVRIFDEYLMAPLLDYIEKEKSWKILFMESAGLTPFPDKRSRQPIAKEVSFLIASPETKKKTGLVLKEPFQLMSRFMNGEEWK
jgi:2,3-bisphosphoglycerate-independent phosphoglycerate mutase